MKHNLDTSIERHSISVTHMKPFANLPANVRGYLDAVFEFADHKSSEIVSIMIFGSVAKGGFSPVSDVDLFVVLADEVPWDEKKKLQHDLAGLELQHKLRKRPKSKKESILTGVDRLAGQFKSQFICYKHDFISGNTAAVAGINPVLESLFLSTRIAFADDVVSARTLWGEELLPQVSVPLLMKAHLVKNCLGFLAFNACALAVFPLVPNATKYSMSALKWMLHTCHFCMTLKSSTIEEAVEFFQAEIDGDAQLMELLSLRSLHRPSFRFVKDCFGTIFKLYSVTVKQAVFPISIESLEHPKRIFL